MLRLVGRHCWLESSTIQVQSNGNTRGVRIEAPMSGIHWRAMSYV